MVRCSHGEWVSRESHCSLSLSFDLSAFSKTFEMIPLCVILTQPPGDSYVQTRIVGQRKWGKIPWALGFLVSSLSLPGLRVLASTWAGEKEGVKIRNRQNTNDYLEMFKSNCYSMWCLCLFILTHPISIHCFLLPFECNLVTWNIPKALSSSLEVKRAAMGHLGWLRSRAAWLPLPHTATDIVVVFVPGWSSSCVVGWFCRCVS